MSKPMRYGKAYWCVKVPKTVSKSGEIYCYADDVVVHVSGSLTLIGGFRKLPEDALDEPEIVLALAPNQWTAFYAASCIDGSAVAVEHWTGEVQR